MVLTDQITPRKLVEKRPDPETPGQLTIRRKPLSIRFADDGIVPNNPRFPLLLYPGAVLLGRTSFDPVTVIDTLFDCNGWARSWRDTIYDFVHYHSQVHEVVGVARGNAKLECGGVKGRVLSLNAGDVVALPAGTGHRLIEVPDFPGGGAYPQRLMYAPACVLQRLESHGRRHGKLTRCPPKAVPLPAWSRRCTGWARGGMAASFRGSRDRRQRRCWRQALAYTWLGSEAEIFETLLGVERPALIVVASKEHLDRAHC
ncbi:cupin [Bradyrhizobium sp. STM 3557]|uniref:cupin n=1 Tax=Bradyrhizobium sp. STM 3557 TaxID=578920 RepID=UPI00388FA95D